MSREDWYRQTTWSPRQEEAFFDRLERSRSAGSKSQYLRIQAHHLEESGLPEPALKLLDLLLREYPDRTQLASAQQQRGRCLLALGQVEQALDAFRDSIRTMRSFPFARSLTHLDFAWAVLRHERRDLIDETLNLFEEFQDDFDFKFPIHAYRYFAAVSIFADWMGDEEGAKRFATNALTQAARTTSSLPHHPKMGVVTHLDDKIHRRLQLLAS